MPDVASDDGEKVSGSDGVSFIVDKGAQTAEQHGVELCLMLDSLTYVGPWRTRTPQSRSDKPDDHYIWYTKLPLCKRSDTFISMQWWTKVSGLGGRKKPISRRSHSLSTTYRRNVNEPVGQNFVPDASDGVRRSSKMQIGGSKRRPRLSGRTSGRS